MPLCTCCRCADNGYSPGSKGTDEVTQAQAMYNNILFPKLHDHQQVLLVPGTFACSNLTYFALDDQAKNVVDKMEGYFKWAKSEKRIAGFNPWSASLPHPAAAPCRASDPRRACRHFNNRTGSPQHGPPCDMELGAVAMPSVMKTLKKIGTYILSDPATRS